MTIVRSGQINNPDLDTLRTWQSMAEALKLLQYLQSNPKEIEKTAQRIVSAIKLTDVEIKCRDDAANALITAKSDLKNIELEISEMRDQIAAEKKRQEEECKKGRADVDIYKQKALSIIESSRNDLGNREQKCSDREKEILQREISIKEKEKALEEETQRMQDFEQKKADWEKDFSYRFNRLSDIEKTRFLKG